MLRSDQLLVQLYTSTERSVSNLTRLTVCLDKAVRAGCASGSADQRFALGDVPVGCCGVRFSQTSAI